MRAAIAGERRDLDLRCAELGIFAADDDVAHQRQLAPAAERIAIDSGNEGLLEPLDGLPGFQAPRLGKHRNATFRHFLDIGARRECLIIAGQDHRADVGIFCGALQRRGKFD